MTFRFRHKSSLFARGVFWPALTLALLAASGAANAHPHVWVAVRSEVVFAPNGKIIGLRHAWEFDEMYSAFAVQGLGKDGKPPTREELAPLAKTNVESLAEFEFFTFAKQAGAKVKFKDGVATIQIALVKRDGRWMISGFHVDTSLAGASGRGI